MAGNETYKVIVSDRAKQMPGTHGIESITESGLLSSHEENETVVHGIIHNGKYWEIQKYYHSYWKKCCGMIE